MYYIYHIPGIKIGVSMELERRLRNQGYSNYEILEVHTDPQIAGDREQELQRQYGYTVDKLHYVKVLEMNSKPKDTSNIGGGRYGINLKKDAVVKGGMITGDKNAKRIVTCPHCNKTASYMGMIRWHFDKCKHKDEQNIHRV